MNAFSIVWISYSLFCQSFINGIWVISEFFSIINNTSVNILVHVPLGSGILSKLHKNHWLSHLWCVPLTHCLAQNLACNKPLVDIFRLL